MWWRSVQTANAAIADFGSAATFEVAGEAPAVVAATPFGAALAALGTHFVITGLGRLAVKRKS